MRDLKSPVGFGWNKAIQRKQCAPAQEEKEEMPIEDFNMIDDDFDMQQEMKADLITDLEQRWDRAFYAALTGYCANPLPGIAWEAAERVANEVIRRGTASRDAAIAEVVG